MESLTILQDIITILKGLGPEALTVLVVICLGWVVKKSPIENRFIPALLPFLGALFYSIIAGPGETQNNIRNPEVKHAGFGFILGVLGWALHHLVIARVERRIAMWRSDKNQKENNEQDPPSN